MRHSRFEYGLSGTFLVTLIWGLLACGNLPADTITLADLPSGDIDTLSIQLIPADGAVDGLPGATVGWGFAIDWTSTNGDWISFDETRLVSETNSSVLGSWTDFIGSQSPTDDFALSSSPGTWMESFDGVSQGVGAYQISNAASSPAQDTGQIAFDFVVYNGDPSTAMQIGDALYTYHAPSTEFLVTVDAPPTVPEPVSWLLFLGGLGTLFCYRRSCGDCRRGW